MATTSSTRTRGLSPKGKAAPARAHLNAYAQALINEQFCYRALSEAQARKRKAEAEFVAAYAAEQAAEAAWGAATDAVGFARQKATK